MLNINKAIIAGHVGSVKIQHTSGGDAVLNLSVATNKRWKDKDEKINIYTQWHRVVVFGKLATAVKDFVKKGTAIYIEGEIRHRKWQDKDGVDRWIAEIIISGNQSMLRVLDKKEKEQDQESDADTQTHPEPEQVQVDEADITGAEPLPPGEDDILF